MAQRNELELEGFLFASAKDARAAEEELKKIQYLNANMNYGNIEKVRKLYDKMLDEKQFRTPIGWTYLLNIRELIVKAGIPEDEIRPIPVNSAFTAVDSVKENPVRQRVKPARVKKDEYKTKFSLAVCMIVLLVIGIIGMFVIAMKSETPNMVNYRQSIVNEYATWEQDLSEREKELKQKERELKLKELESKQ